MANIQKRERKNGPIFRVQVRIKGFPEQTKSFKRLTDAKMWAQQTEASIRKGEFQNVIKTAGKKTLREVIVRYRREILPRKSEGTRRAESTHLDYWEAAFGDYALSNIETDKINDKMTELEATGYSRKTKMEDGEEAKPIPRSLRTLKYYRHTLAMLFKFAKQWGWTNHSPVDGVNKITRLRNERVRYLSDEERKALLKACKSSDSKQLYPIVVFALSTGARKG
jgi:integrase